MKIMTAYDGSRNAKLALAQVVKTPALLKAYTPVGVTSAPPWQPCRYRPLP
nr:hypothetical protein [Halomonas sp.]